MSCEINNVLVVRFRQLGDAVLTTPLLNTLRKNFPQAQIDFVVNDNLAPLFAGHPSIDHVITFTKEERSHTLTYLKKVWRIMHENRYDVIIDKRSTFNTIPFALFSLHSAVRVALKKPYTWLLYNYRVGPVGDQPMVDHILEHLKPLERIRNISYDRSITLAVTAQEQADFRTYLQQQGLDLQRPVVLVGVTAKLEDKTWPKERMTEVLRRFITRFPQVQLIFNYAPGREEQNARDIFRLLGSPSSVFIDVQAQSSRQLAVMSTCINFYFGNEGGARHIVHAMGKPSLVVCSPFAKPHVWIPQDSIPAVGITNAEATTDHVWQTLERFTLQQLQR